MNKELLIEALEVLKTRVEVNMDVNDAHFSRFYINKLADIDNELEKIQQTKYDN
jgi:hypothetical protein